MFSMPHQIMEAISPTPRNTLLTHVPETKGYQLLLWGIRSCRLRLKCELTLVPFDPENASSLNESVVGQDVVWNVK